MLIPISWLKDYVDINMPVEELADILTIAGLEVEGIQALDRGKTGRLDAPLDHAAFAVDQLQLGKTQQKARVVAVLCGAETGKLLVLAQEGRQLEFLEMMGEQDPRFSAMGGLAHGRGPPIRLI